MATSCGDSLAVANVWITELEPQDFTEGATTVKSRLKNRSKSLMIEEDETDPCDAEDAFYLKPTSSYRVEFIPADADMPNPKHYKWTLKIDYNSNMTFQSNEVFQIEGEGRLTLDILVPVYLRLKRTWVEFEIKETATYCSPEFCGLDQEGNCVIYRRGIGIDAGAICTSDISCIPFDNITQYEYIRSMRVNGVNVKACLENNNEGYCSNFVDVISMFGADILSVYVGNSGVVLEETVTIWFDRDYDGDYSDEPIAGQASGKGIINLNVTMPNISTSTFFTMRVKLENGLTSSGPCEVVEGEIQDYIVLFNLND